MQKVLGIFFFHFTVKYLASLKLWSKVHLLVTPKKLSFLHSVWLQTPFAFRIWVKIIIECDKAGNGRIFTDSSRKVAYTSFKKPTATCSVILSESSYVDSITTVILCTNSNTAKVPITRKGLGWECEKEALGS